MSAKVSDALGMERAAAKAARAFHRHDPPTGDRREALANFAAKFYSTRMKVDPGETTGPAIESLASAHTLAVEVAHDGQLPHLGIVRMVLKAHDIARLDGDAVTLYLVGDHYSPDMRPDNIHFGMPLQGRAPDQVKHPPKLRIGKAGAHRPFRWLSPPTQGELTRLESQVGDFIENNLGYTRREGTTVVKDAEARLAGRAQVLFEVLEVAAKSVSSMGDWLVRVQHDLFHRMLGREAGQILFLPMADLAEVFHDDLAAIARSSDRVRAAKTSVSDAQKEEGEEPYQRRPEPSSFWVYCPSCERRQREPWTPGSTIEFRCASCGHIAELGEREIRWRLMPDIVAYEVGLFRQGIDAWVVGSHAPYHPVIREVDRAVFNAEPPPTFFLTSVPTFRGLGDSPEGFGKTRLLRALLEIEPGALAEALRAPWDVNPRIASDLLTAA